MPIRRRPLTSNKRCQPCVASIKPRINHQNWSQSSSSSWWQWQTSWWHPSFETSPRRWTWHWPNGETWDVSEKFIHLWHKSTKNLVQNLQWLFRNQSTQFIVPDGRCKEYISSYRKSQKWLQKTVCYSTNNNTSNGARSFRLSWCCVIHTSLVQNRSLSWKVEDEQWTEQFLENCCICARNEQTSCTAWRKQQERLKRIVRYLKGVPSAKSLIEIITLSKFVNVCPDSDWAGQATTCKSTSGVRKCNTHSGQEHSKQ